MSVQSFLIEFAIDVWVFGMIYFFGLLLTIPGEKKIYHIGVKRTPKKIAFWLKPKWIFRKTFQRKLSRVVGVFYQCIFSFATVPILIFTLVYSFFDLEMSYMLRRYWMIAAAIGGCVAVIVLLILEISRRIFVAIARKNG